LEVADPSLEGGKVAVLRPHSACHLAARMCRIQIYTQMSSRGEGALLKKPPINVQAAILHRILSEGHESRK
jgi:hypothetical protein